VDSVNLRDPRIGFYEWLEEAIARYGVTKGRLRIELNPEERQAGLTVNEYETLLMRHDLMHVLNNPLKFVAEKGRHAWADPRSIPAKTLDYAKYDVVRALNKLVADGLVRYLGVSNFDLKLLKSAAALSATPLLTDQVSYSLPDRTCVQNGVLAYCQENDLLLTAYSPVKRRFISGNKSLKALAAARGVTPQQVALAWLARQPRVVTIPMSFDPKHQADNLAAVDLDLSESELVQLAG
jgi:diketogulonate reductase-like aldo/keto reductase